MRTERVLIMGAAGRDFHDFNVVYRDDPTVEVVAFTATQIPGIADRRYPPELAGERYPAGIPIRPEAELETLIRDLRGRHRRVRLQRRQPRAGDARGEPRAGRRRGLQAARPRRAPMLAEHAPGRLRVRGPHRQRQEPDQPLRGADCSRRRASRSRSSATRCPTGTSSPSACQRYETYADLDRYETTIEEREEYEPHLDAGRLVFAGVDYEQILRAAEAESDVVIWDGGNNDLPFYRPDLAIVVADPLRPGHELRYHPGEANLRLADVVVINKIDSATPEAVATVRAAHREPSTREPTIVEARSSLALEGGEIRGRTVVVVEDGPTLTHGGMTYGAGDRGGQAVRGGRDGGPAAVRHGRARRRPSRSTRTSSGCCRRWATATSRSTSSRRRSTPTPADVVLAATPIDLTRVLHAEQAGRPRPLRARAGHRVARGPAGRDRRAGEGRPSAAADPGSQPGRPASHGRPRRPGSGARPRPAPRSRRPRPAASRASATFASASGWVSTSVVIPIRAASSRNSTASGG